MTEAAVVIVLVGLTFATLSLSVAIIKILQSIDNLTTAVENLNEVQKMQEERN